MARETLFQLHHLQQNSLKCRGFTLLELIIAMSVMVVLLGAAVPSFSDLIERNKIKRLATEIEWLLVHAKSEAVMQGKNVYVNAPLVSGSRINSGWCVFSSTKIDKKSCDDIDTSSLSSIDSTNFSGVTFENSSTLTQFFFEPIYGKPNNIGFGGNFDYQLGDYHLKTVIFYKTGRLYTCLQKGSNKLSNYEFCE
ncbi:TPA: GspH/FimT family pseudopilin [Photobacterium damselae]|uniref:GspH/FimT family pseudopilin n=1 Tax=Photobacterium damselae TaxID=38293 RepID=UPI00254357F1